MITKIIKITAYIVIALLVILTLLYLLAPHFIKYRMSKVDIRANPGKYKGIDAFPMNGKVIFVTAHPDDLEFMAGGTLPKLIERGNDVYMVILTDGGKQRYMPKFYSRLIVKTRRKEQLAIAKVEGLKGVYFADYPDGSLKVSKTAVERVKKIAQDLKITHVFTFEPGKRKGYYDSDHDAAGRIGTAAAEECGPVKSIYYFRAENPDIVIDISDTFERKLEIMFMFTEFKYKKRMLDAMHRAWATTDGRRIDVKYAEVFRRQDLRKLLPLKKVKKNEPKASTGFKLVRDGKEAMQVTEMASKKE